MIVVSEIGGKFKFFVIEIKMGVINVVVVVLEVNFVRKIINVVSMSVIIS